MNHALRTSLLSAICSLLLLSVAVPAGAARSDSQEPLTIDAGQMKIEGKRGVRRLTGNVEIMRGSLVLKASEVEMREGTQGQQATAFGSAKQPATFRQKRLENDEVVEGRASRIEYDAVTEVVRLVGDAQVRVLRKGVPADQVDAPVIVYDHLKDVVDVIGGPSPAAQAGARVRAIVSPRAASAPANAPRASEEGAPR